jgi:GxxExxY protein
MEQRLREGGIPFLAKPATRLEFIYRDQVVDVFEPDFLVAERLILELKHQVEGLVPENESQVLNYLKFWHLELGLLANFALHKAITHRVPRLPFEAALKENYDHIADLLRDEHKPTLRSIRDGLLCIYQMVGLGYTATTYQKLAMVEFRHRNLAVQADLIAEPVFHERRLPRSPISPFIVDNVVCVQVDAIHDDVSARLTRTMQTHLRLTEKPFGIVATFGRRQLSIQGVKL